MTDTIILAVVILQCFHLIRYVMCRGKSLAKHQIQKLILELRTDRHYLHVLQVIPEYSLSTVRFEL